MTVIIDPRSNYLYGSYYIAVLKHLYGRSVLFDLSPFKELGDIGNDLRFIIRDEDNETKYFLHLNDPYVIQEKEYAWCDVYGNVNANFSHYPKDKYPKQVSLVPSFGIRIEKSLLKTIAQAVLQLPTLWKYVVNRSEWNKYSQQHECNKKRNLKHYFTRRYRAWKERLPLSVYINNVTSDDNYVFFLSTLWYNNEWNNNDETVNKRRANFIRACKSIECLTYEGGLLGDSSSSNEKFADVLAAHGEPFDKWIEKTKKSALVFNTPAFWDCHGWKLGEYLALGKCIVSTKLSNDLPYPLEHGKNIHFVEDTEDAIREAIEYILAHPKYRHQLERGARAYWEQYGTPEASLELLGIV